MIKNSEEKKESNQITHTLYPLELNSYSYSRTSLLSHSSISRLHSSADSLIHSLIHTVIHFHSLQPIEMSAPTPPSTSSPFTWALSIHGGAGAISREYDPERFEYLAALRHSLAAGSAVLAAGGSSVDACVAAVRCMEDEPLFNAGVGSVLTANGKHEMDAAVMRGSDRAAGSVAGITTVKNPVVLAQKVMELSPHVMLIGPGAEEFASTTGCQLVDNSYFTTPARLEIHRQLVEKEKKSKGRGEEK